MAQSLTPRLGLTTWSADTDNHPGRPGANSTHAKLDQLVAVWAGAGLLSARPSPSIAGRFWVSTNVGDGGRLSIDLGDKWLDLSTLGGGGAPPAPNVGGPGSEGVSNRAMRADARIPLPLATADNHGALASQHFELLESASAGGTAWSVPIRDGSGRIRLGANPSHVLDAVTKQYADDLGSASIVGNTIVRRWGDGAVSGPDPSKPEFYATRRYVDSRTSREAWKTNIRPIPYGLDGVLGLTLNAWEYTDEAPATGEGMGPMVEQMADVMPELTVDGEDGAPERILDRDYIWVLTKAVQELATQNKRLWDIVTEHQAHLDQLDDGARADG